MENQAIRKLGIIPLAATFYLVVSGGPEGLEDVVRQAGPGASLLLLMIVPIIWSLPCALMTAELTTAIPVDGGYYLWVRRAFGPLPGLSCAIWSWIYTIFDTALYPTLALGLIKQSGLIPWAFASPDSTFIVSFLVFLPVVVLNIVGVRHTGQGNLLFGGLILIPFLLLLPFGLGHAGSASHAAPFNADKGFLGSMGLGLTVAMWNYLGWDNLSPIAGEVKDPQRSFPRAIAITLPVIIFVYVAVVMAAVAIFPNWREYETGIWVEIARRAGGAPLFAAVLVAGIASSLGQFNSMLLGISRIPMVLAEDGYLPKPFAQLHPRFGTPVVAIIVCTVLAFLFSMRGFGEVVEFDVVFYSAAVVLEFLALARLRQIEPDLARPFRIPGGWFGIWLVAVPPILLSGVTIYLSMAKLDPVKIAILGFGLALPVLLFLLNPAPKAAEKGP